MATSSADVASYMNMFAASNGDAERLTLAPLDARRETVGVRDGFRVRATDDDVEDDVIDVLAMRASVA